jgi:erythromycin esterase-like protein
MTVTYSTLGEVLREAAHPLAGAADDYDPLLEMIGDAQFVLIGEASHGTHEFYQARAEITKRLIVEKGFTAIAVEADWPDAYRVNCYARGEGEAFASDQALGGFLRFPTWMWRNTVVLDFVGWLRAHNDRLPPNAPRVGFYGLDLYSLYTSISEVLTFLNKVDPEAAERARRRYACFERFEEDSQRYGYAAGSGYVESCEDAVVSQLQELRRGAGDLLRRDGRVSEDEIFYAEQNARLVRNAEAYYRTMFRGQVSSWNLRDQHMAETLDALVAHLERRMGRTRVVVWAHNSHLGDARATQMGDYGEHNVGQLVRQRHGHNAVLVGFTTYAGTVTAASDWDGPVERKRVRPALPESYEATFRAVAVPNFLLNLRDNNIVADALRPQRLERAIGVIYLPQTERASHYFYARLSHQFDTVIHYDQTHAVEPLERVAPWTNGDAPETFPTSL